MAVSDPAAVSSASPLQSGRAPGWLMQAATLVTAIGLLDAASAPGCFIFEFLGFALLSIVLAGVWLVRLLLALRRNQRAQWRRIWSRWATGPAILAAVFMLMERQIPVRIRFGLSRNQLNRLSKSSLAAGPMMAPYIGGVPIQKAGAFNVAVVQVTSEGAFYFMVPGTEFSRSYSGFVYSPHATPWDPEGSVEPLDGPWYIWNTSW